MRRWPMSLHRQTPGLRSRLVLLALACALPLLLAAAIVTYPGCRQVIADRDGRAIARAQAVVLGADIELAALRAVLGALAASPALAAGDVRAFGEQVRQAARAAGLGPIVLDDADGLSVVDSRIDTANPSAAGALLAAMQPPRSLREATGAIVEVPVRAGPDARRYRLAAGLDDAVLARLTAQPAGDDGWIGLFDDHGAWVAGSPPARQDRLGPTANVVLQRAMQLRDQGAVDDRPARGAATRLAFSRSPASGWSAVVATAGPPGLAGLCHPPPALLAGALALLAAGLVLAVWIGRGIVSSIEGLVAPAIALSCGRTPTVAATNLRECDAVATALGAASRLLSARTDQRDQARRARDALAFQARHDGLTTLVNRATLLQRLRERIEWHRQAGGCLTVFFVDLDDFKAINDRLGHAVGDMLLRAFANRLRGAVREVDIAGRLGGDEFAVVIDGLAPAAAEPIAQALLDRLSQPFALGDLRLAVSASIGLAGFPEDGGDAATLLIAADRAMYAAKAAGKGDFRRSGWAPV